MAIQTKTLSSAQHDWYATRSSLPANAPLVDHKLAYYASKGFGSNASIHRPLSQIENEWLSVVSGRDSDYLYELWSGACAAQSVPVGKSIDECMFNFFTSVGSGTNP